MKRPVWNLATILNSHGTELTGLLLELYSQVGLGPQDIEFADGPAVFDGFGWGDLLPGSHIRIHWKPEAIIPDWSPPEDLIDTPKFYEDGYVFTLPSIEGNDVMMAGVVHIPNPGSWDGKSDIEPQWLTLNSLVAMNGLDRIELLRKG